jgi:uncharacterized protein (TIGR03437 family)
MLRRQNSFVLCLLMFALLTAVAAAQQPAASIAGDYNFVQFSASEPAGGGPAGPARNAGGTLTLDPSGAVRIRGWVGEGSGLGVEQRIEGRWEWRPAAGVIALTSPATPDATLKVHIGDGGSILLGSTGSAAVHDLFIAVRVPALPVTAQGDYGAAYFLLQDGRAGGAATAFLDFTAGSGRLSASRLIGHTAQVDDVNRIEQIGGTYTIEGGGGSIAFSGESDIVRGSLKLFASPGADVLLGFSTDAGRRDLLIAVRKQPDAGTISFSGLFWLGEVGAESEFLYQPDTTRLMSASGALRAAGDGFAYIGERVNTAGRLVDLSTVNTYRIWTGGDFLATQLRQGLHNFTFGAGSLAFAGAQVGISGDLTLDHGIFFGLRAVRPPPAAGVFLSPFVAGNAAAPLVPGTAMAPGGVYSLFGSNLAPAARSAASRPLPESLEGVRVLINGQPAGLFSVSPSQINILAPASLMASSAAIQVNNNGSLSGEVEVSVAPTSPAAFTVSQNGAGPAIVTHADFSLVSPDRPARPGESVIVFTAGLGAVLADPTGTSRASDPGIRVLFNGVSGDVAFAGLVPGFVGLYQMNVSVPAGTRTGVVSLAIATSNAFSDLTEVAVRAESGCSDCP